MKRAVLLLVIPATGLLFTLVALSGCATGAAGANSMAQPIMYPLPPAPPRIAYVTSINGAAIFGKRSNRLHRFLFGRDAEEPKTIVKPFGLAAGHETLLVCDTQQNVVHVFDFKNRRLDTMGATGPGKLLKPVDVDFDDQGNRYVADAFRRQIVIFSPDNQPIKELGRPGDDLFKPVAVTFHEGKLYILNGKLHRVEVLDPTTGKLLEAFGQKGEEPGQMLFPNGLAVDDAGKVYVTDLLNCRVQVFAPSGRLLHAFGRPGDRAGEFSRPKHLAIGSQGVTYVVDAGFQRVQMFDGQGQVLMLFGGPGTGPGSMTLPAGICIDRTLLPYFADRIPPEFEAEYLIFVGDQFGRHKISVYAFGHLRSSGSDTPPTQSRTSLDASTR